MKFEDLKLPRHDLEFHRCDRVARAVFDQMHAHYEDKLAEANRCPQELLEYVQQFFKVAQQGREAGERLRAAIGEDKPKKLRPRLSEQTQKEIERLWPEVAAAICEACGWQKPAPEWRLPDPPHGQQWHRDDWTQDMLVDAEGRQYRPLLLGERNEDEDQVIGIPDGWFLLAGRSPTKATHPHTRTRRSLPAPAEYVPLGPEDVPPGSAVRRDKNDPHWELVLELNDHSFRIGNDWYAWEFAARSFEILRPGSTTWEPCKKPKA